MPFFKTTQNILVDSGEYFESKWMDSNTLITPPKSPWTYDREMQIEDVDLWEVIYEDKIGVYAAWSPHAEFYLIRNHWHEPELKLETFYGPKAMQRVYNRAKELGQTLPLNQYWVDPDKMWLY